MQLKQGREAGDTVRKKTSVSPIFLSEMAAASQASNDRRMSYFCTDELQCSFLFEKMRKSAFLEF